MATAKKPVKKTSVKRAPVKATSATKVTHKSSKAAPAMRSFHVAKAPRSFFTFELTEQTAYWAILCAVVLAFGVWVLSINIQIQAIYDQIDSSYQSN